MKKLLKIIALILMAFLIVLGGLFFIKRPRTPAIKDASGQALAESIHSLEKVVLGGVEQWILIRGHNRSHPLLLFLHGGPGMPMMYMAHKFQRNLEDRFVCVQWDQRGAGKSYNKNIPIETMTVEQMLSDGYDLIQMLRQRFQQPKIYLVGHSWGSYLGMLMINRHPELFHAYVGVGQVVHEQKAREITAGFLRETAQAINNSDALKELEQFGPAIHEKWLFKFGGELYGETSFMPFIWTGLKAQEYGLMDTFKVSKGSNFSSRHMQYDAIPGQLADHVKKVSVPVYFFTGRYDYNTPFDLIEWYYEILDAPFKQMVWFDKSAHFPFFSEPEEFASRLKAIL